MQSSKLFSDKVLARHIDLESPIDQSHAKSLKKWSSIAVQNLKEITNHGSFSHIILKMLGYSVAAESPESWSAYPEFAIGNKSVDIGLGQFSLTKSKLLVPLELKGGKTDLDLTMPGRNKSPVEQAWEYAVEAGAQWVMVSNYKEIRLYSYAKGKSSYETFDLFGMHNSNSEYNKFILLLTANNLLGGKTQKILDETDRADKDITNELYKEYSYLRKTLIDHLLSGQNTDSTHATIQLAQKILDRLLFISFAEDRYLLPPKTISNAYSHLNPYDPKPVWHNFKCLFRAIDKGNQNLGITGYNGGLFSTDPVLDRLEIPNEICELFKRISDYDFNTDINVNILGHIFEQSISDLEFLRSSIDGPSLQSTKGKRKKDGVYYTPEPIAKFIVENTVGLWLKDRREQLGFDSLPELVDADYGKKLKTKNKFTKKVQEHINFWLNYKQCLSQIKICDPSCGSGAFLNQAFDYIYSEGQRINGELQRLRGGIGDLLRWDTHIIQNNLFGIDINNESVEITKLSLWIKTAKKDEKLTQLDENIKCDNSLVYFKTKHKRNRVESTKIDKILENGGFDVIIGNPPYGATIDKSLQEFLISHYSTYEYQVNTYSLFFELGLKSLNKGGYLGFITPATFLYQHYYRKTRSAINKYALRSLAKYQFQVFPDANIGDTVSTILQNESTHDYITVYESKDKYNLHVNMKQFEYKSLVDGDVMFTTEPRTRRNSSNVQTHNLGDIVTCLPLFGPAET